MAKSSLSRNPLNSKQKYVVILSDCWGGYESMPKHKNHNKMYDTKEAASIAAEKLNRSLPLADVFFADDYSSFYAIRSLKGFKSKADFANDFHKLDLDDCDLPLEKARTLSLALENGTCGKQVKFFTKGNFVYGLDLSCS